MTEENRIARVEHCLWHRDPEKGNDVFREIHNVVHLDETWYYLTHMVLVEHYYLSPHGPDPERNSRHKSHLPQCMFLSAIGIWPIAPQVPAQIVFANRPRGTPLEWKDIIRDKGRYTQYLLEQVIPTIMEQ